MGKITTKERFERLLVLIKKDNLFCKTLANKYNELYDDDIVNYDIVYSTLYKFGFKISEYRKNRIIELRNNGFTNKQIADLLGMNPDSVSLCAVKNGHKIVKKRRRNFFWKDYKFKQRLIRLFKENDFNLTRVSKKVKIPTDRLIKIINYHKLSEWITDNKKNIKEINYSDRIREVYDKGINIKPIKVARILGCSRSLVSKVRRNKK